MLAYLLNIITCGAITLCCVYYIMNQDNILLTALVLLAYLNFIRNFKIALPSDGRRGQGGESPLARNDNCKNYVLSGLLAFAILLSTASLVFAYGYFILGERILVLRKAH